MKTSGSFSVYAFKIVSELENKRNWTPWTFTVYGSGI